MSALPRASASAVSSSVAPLPICLIDASIFIFRYYFALPDHWWSRDYGTAAVYGLPILVDLLQERPPYGLVRMMKVLIVVFAI